MMDHMMGGGMMWSMGLVWLLVVVVLLLGAAALVKYLFFSGRSWWRRPIRVAAHLPRSPAQRPAEGATLAYRAFDRSGGKA